MKADIGLIADDYRRHRAGLPASLFERLAAKGIGIGGQHVVDVGTGTGSLALRVRAPRVSGHGHRSAVSYTPEGWRGRVRASARAIPLKHPRGAARGT